MVWTDQARQRCFETVKPVICERENGTAFPIFAGGGSIWYVTCAHVVKFWEHDPAKVVVGGCEAKEVIDAGTEDLDLALIRIDSGEAVDSLALEILPEPSETACIPGCYRAATQEKPFLGEWRDVRLTGKRSDVISANGRRRMKGWRLDVPEEPLVEGYSGSPVLCPETGRVFAVAVMKTSGGGIAICISNLLPILPPELGHLVSTRDRAGFSETVRALFRQLGQRITVAEIRQLCRQSSGLPELDWPPGNAMEDYVGWLLGRRQYSTGRHPLHDVLAWLETGADPGEIQPIREAKQMRDLRRRHYGSESPAPLATHAALLWDDPKYHRKRSFPGLA